MMHATPAHKYTAFRPIALPNRTWPNRQLTTAPIWMSTDLRDGNQALIEPLSVQAKLHFFKRLVAIGFKEIEIGFPSASQVDYDFARLLITENHIPSDVTIEVLTPARQELIEKTFQAVAGAPRVIMHLYNPIAPIFRQWVYQSNKKGIKQLALQGAQWIKQTAAHYPGTHWVYQYSPEAFSSTEMEYALEVCNGVASIWQPTPQHKMILNLPATVEMSTPNTYADQIEWMHRHLDNRSAIILSVHPHNDRGTAVAAAELALMAGAERVEGCLFGNGERTGNVCLVTLALNLYSQGVNPGLDFSQLDQLRFQVEQWTQLPVHPRHPYAGELVFTAFSGSHQDAIKKGLAAQQGQQQWQVPYLPIDPQDIGRNYDAVVRVNSQSGKGGVSFVLQQATGFDLPRRLQMEFSAHVQRLSDATGSEIQADQLVQLFNALYFNEQAPLVYLDTHFAQTPTPQGQLSLNVVCQYQGETRVLTGEGQGPLEAACRALSQMCGQPLHLVDYHEHALTEGANSLAICYVEVKLGEQPPCFGVGRDSNIVIAALRALVAGVSRQLEGQA